MATAPPTILVIDDEPLILRAMTTWLTHAGFTVHSANTAQAARDFTRQQTPELIVSDVMMPDLDGPQLIKELKAAGVSCPVMFTSGDPSFRVVDESLQVPGATFLPKPFTASELVDAVFETLGQR